MTVRQNEPRSASDGELLIHTMRSIRDMTSGTQREYYDWVLSQAKPVTISSVYADEDIGEVVDEFLESYELTAKQCYANAWKLANYNYGEFEYVEGQLSMYGIPIDHAWNRHVKTGLHVDVTSEIALGKAVAGSEYMAIMVYSAVELSELSVKTGHSGGYLLDAFKATRDK